MEPNFKNKNSFQITLELINEKKIKFEYKILNLDIEKDNYLYDVFFEENKNSTNPAEVPKFIKLSHNSQFDYYIHYIRNIKKKTKNERK